MTEVVDMVDAIGANASRVPAGYKRVAIYLTGSGGIAWSGADVARLVKDDPELQTVYRIVQANNPADTYLNVRTLVIDIEPGAATVGVAIEICKVRKAHGLRTTLYYFKAEEEAVQGPVNAAGLQDYVDYWLAWWMNDRSQAIALLGHPYVAVQYRSASYLDYSVTLANWPEPITKPKPSPKRSQALLTATEHGAGAAWEIHGVENKGDTAIQNSDTWHLDVSYHKGSWGARPMAATKALNPKARLAGLSLNVHPKVAAVGTTAAALTAVRGALAAFGVHVPLTDTEQAAILAALPTVAGWLKSSGVTFQ